MSRRFTAFPKSFLNAALSTRSIVSRSDTREDSSDNTSQMLSALGNLCLSDARVGKALHVFVEGARMYEWLTAMRLTEPKLIEELQERWRGSRYNAVCFHWEDDGDSISILLSVPKTKIRSEIGHYCQLVLFSPDKVHVQLSLFEGLPLDTAPPRTKEVYFLLSGLSCYLAAFPECLRDGAPSDVTSLVHYGGCKNKGRRMTLSVAPQLQEEHSISPHFRRGHFRVLDSEKFTHKRGQVVFVRSTFVLGKAQTVTENIAQ